MIKRNYKLIVGIIIGAILAGTTVYAATIISSINVGYSNESSKLVATNVQDAIDEVYDKMTKYIDTTNLPNIVVAYTYNESGNNKCITGDEKTCKVTYCYNDKEKSSCNVGDIILYRVNDDKIVRFHVIKDNGNTLTLQSQKNTVYNIAWYDGKDNTTGPLTILNALERATEEWTNVNNLNYTIGDENTTLGYSGISNQTKVVYKLERKNVKARLLTESDSIGLCGYDSMNRNCKIFMYNYLSLSTSCGGTVNDQHIENNAESNEGYWMMNAYTEANSELPGINAFCISYYGSKHSCDMTKTKNSARAVVEITKP